MWFMCSKFFNPDAPPRSRFRDNVYISGELWAGPEFPQRLLL
jgi:hypothetical protein